MLQDDEDEDDTETCASPEVCAPQPFPRHTAPQQAPKPWKRTGKDHSIVYNRIPILILTLLSISLQETMLVFVYSAGLFEIKCIKNITLDMSRFGIGVDINRLFSD